MGLAREELQKKEAIKDQQRKAAEKKADVSYKLTTETYPSTILTLTLFPQLEAKARVKAQIEADKRERAEKAARDKALREGKTDVATTPANVPRPAAAAAPSASTSNEARLRVRAPGGQWMGTLPAETTLGQVESMVRDAGKADGPLTVSQQ